MLGLLRRVNFLSLNTTRLTKIGHDISRVLIPQVCIGCNYHLNRGEHHLCTICRNYLPLTEYSFDRENALDRVFYGRIEITKASSFLFYANHGSVKQLIHHLKYKNQEHIGRFLGDWYGQKLKENGFLKAIDYVVPVPLHKTKLKQRGYNQVSLFAERIAKHINAIYRDDILIKTANTKTQTSKTRIGRWHNNKALFKLTHTEMLKNKKVLLLDDVITTGATIEICARALKEAEGVSIYVASMAVVSQFQ